MIRFHPLHNLRGFMLLLGAGVLAALVLLTPAPVRSAQNPAPPKTAEVLSPPSPVKNEAALTTPEQKGGPKKSTSEKTKTDAAELSTLADQLRDELNKINLHILPVDIIRKTEEVEKLAKKIKGEANE